MNSEVDRRELQNKRSRICRAVKRLASEELVRVRELTAEAGATDAILRRWIIEGFKIGPGQHLHLDGVRRPGVGWLSSRPAVRRFKAELERLAKAKRSEQTAPVEGGVL
jgi:hypothetical protein